MIGSIANFASQHILDSKYESKFHALENTLLSKNLRPANTSELNKCAKGKNVSDNFNMNKKLFTAFLLNECYANYLQDAEVTTNLIISL